MKRIKLALQGMLIGLGGIAPGLSGSMLMVVMGLYAKTIDAVANFFKDPKKNLKFLVPLGIGAMVGIVIFSRIIGWSLEYFEVQTRLMFFGLLLGSIPLFYDEVEKRGSLKLRHYLAMVLAFVLGVYFLALGEPNMVSGGEMNVLQAFVLGFIGISAMVVPGVNSAALMSSLGMYGYWIDLTSLNNVTLAVYLPAGLGVLVGGFVLVYVVNKLLKRWYTAVFATMFGLFLSIIASVLRTSDGGFVPLGLDIVTYAGIGLGVLGVFLAWVFSRINKNASSEDESALEE